MTLDNVRRTWNTIAPAYAEGLPDVSYEAELDLALVRLFAELADDGPVLDAGCGTGRMTAHLRTLNPSLALTGLDLSPGMLAESRRAVPDVDFIEGDLMAMPFADATFAGVLLWYSTIHLLDDQFPDLFAEVRRVLRPGGIVLLGFQAGTGERHVTHSWGQDVDVTVYFRDVDAVAAGLEDAGFSVHTRLHRGVRPEIEKSAQGFVLALS